MTAKPSRPFGVGVESDRLCETERLLLRPPRRDDDLSEFAADEKVQRWTGGPDSAGALLERWLGRWERNGIGQFVVELDGHLIGRVGFVVWDGRTWETSAYDLAGEHARLELGWAILSGHWGNGYAVEAATAARDWASGRGPVISLIDPANARSIRVAEKLGARPTETVATPHGPAVVWVHPRATTPR